MEMVRLVLELRIFWKRDIQNVNGSSGAEVVSAPELFGVLEIFHQQSYEK